MMRLHLVEQGPFPRRILLYLHMARRFGVEHAIEIVPIDPAAGLSRTPEFLAMSPSGSNPVLDIGGGDYISQSQAILEYLEELRPTPLGGDGPASRSLITSQCQLINEVYYFQKPALTHQSPYLRGFTPRQYPHAAALFMSIAWQRFNDIGSLMGDASHLAGDGPTIADIMLFPLVEYTREVYDVSIPPHLRGLVRWYGRFSTEAADFPRFLVSDEQHAVMMAMRRP